MAVARVIAYRHTLVRRAVARVIAASSIRFAIAPRWRAVAAVITITRYSILGVVARVTEGLIIAKASWRICAAGELACTSDAAAVELARSSL